MKLTELYGWETSDDWFRLAPQIVLWIAPDSRDYGVMVLVSGTPVGMWAQGWGCYYKHDKLLTISRWFRLLKEGV